MDIVDIDLERAELDAALPHQYEPTATAATTTTSTGAPADKTETGEAIERVPSGSGSSTSTASSAAAAAAAAGRAARAGSDGNMARLPTQRDAPGLLERNETAMSRIHTQRSQHEGTVGEGVRSRASRRPVPPMGAGKPYPPPLPEREAYVVEFDGPDDPLHGMNWSLRKKLLTSAMLAFTTFVSVFGSSIFSAGLPQVGEQFHIGREVVTLGISFYVLGMQVQPTENKLTAVGFAFGPIFWAPLSELKGRRLPIVVSTFFLAIFNFAVAVSKDVQTMMISRFFAGFFGSAPLSVVAAVFSDIFSNEARGMAVTIFAICVFTGPLTAPFIGGFIATSHLGWRWTEYLVGILVRPSNELYAELTVDRPLLRSSWTFSS
jgi:DHA1 family multidrug resistance protein-like MFS transporter